MCGRKRTLEKRVSARKHADGSPCPEGTQRLPASGVVCCDAFWAHTLACYFDIRYEYWEGRAPNWHIIIAPAAGGGGIAIQYCPHCGAKF